VITDYALTAFRAANTYTAKMCGIAVFKNCVVAAGQVRNTEKELRAKEERCREIQQKK
jgi:hypothetical protein